ncbi:helicase-exonuclease AddAB subunit AddB [Paradesulfitobacterium aromaticivorans]
MSLRLVLGRAGSGKSTFCLEEIRAELREQPLGAPLILLVPEQATYQMEVALANTPDLGGIMRAQILSFKRLSWRILSETGGGQKVRIGETAKRMLLSRILLRHREELRTFARSATRPGMAESLARTISEFKAYRISPRDLEELSVADQTLADKLGDLAFLYAEFEQVLANVRDPDDDLSLAADKLPAALSLHGAKIWIDGFKGFTPQELKIVEELLGLAADVTVTIPLDPALTEGDVGEGVFYGPWQTYQELRRLASTSTSTSTSASAPSPAPALLPPVLLTEGHRFKQEEIFSYLERFFFVYPSQPHRAEGEQAIPVHIAAAPNPRAEVEGIAREMRKLARVQGLRWQEMAILSRDLSEYVELIAQVFRLYEIPHFLDYKRPVIHHPLIELLLSALEAAASNWAYEPLFRCLKTDFFPLERDQVDRLENYCLSAGIDGRAWPADKDWQVSPRREFKEGMTQLKEEEKALNASRRLVYAILEPFVAAVAPRPDGKLAKVREVTEALYFLLEKLGVPEHLKSWTEQATAEGDLAGAGLQEQIWQAVVDLLDEMTAGLGDEELALEEYAFVLSSGLESLHLGLIPPGLDQVLIGSLDRSRNPEVRVLFILGASEGVLPARGQFNGLLNAEDRDKLGENGLALSPGSQIHEEQYFIYTALTRAREFLYLTYPLTDEEGKGLAPSPVIARLKSLLPGIKEEIWGQEDGLEVVSHPLPLLPLYALQLRKLRSGEGLTPLWRAAEKWLTQSPGTAGQAKLLLTGAAATNREEKLSRPLARRLYGRRLLASVSRLERFAQCPFSHYADYALRLREREVFQLSRPDMGKFFHGLLYKFAEKVRLQQLDWAALTKEQSQALLAELTPVVAAELPHNILSSSARYRYLTHKLQRTVLHAVRVLSEHARSGVFVPIELEVRFGPGSTLPGVDLPLADGDSLVLQGQIDRIDAAVLEGQVYMRIIDYKSRESTFSLSDVYYGLDLQLLAYLDVALQGSELFLPGMAGVEDGEAVPAGFIYFPVLEPRLHELRPLGESQLEEKRLKSVKVAGYFLANPSVLQAMDKALADGKSDLLGLKLNNDGSFRKNSKVLSLEEFQALRVHLYRILKQYGEQILEGDIALAPYRQGKRNGCQYCSYKPVCHFDPFLPENRYRVLPPLATEDVMHSMMEISKAQAEGGEPENG